MPYRRPTSLVLSEAERSELEGWARRRRTSQALALRARIVLRAADGLSNTAIAQELGIAKPTVGKWRERFARLRSDGLLDEPRPGAPRRIGDEEIAALVDRTLSTTPEDATHWSLRSMARTSGLSVSTIGRIWRAFGLQPHRSETFKLSTDPFFAEKVRDIVGLYLAPPDRAVVLCLDEKSEVQALDRTQPLLPLRPGQVDEPVCGSRRGGRPGDRTMLPAPPRGGVPQIPGRGGGASPAGPRRSPGPRQLGHAQDQAHSGLAG